MGNGVNGHRGQGSVIVKAASSGTDFATVRSHSSMETPVLENLFLPDHAQMPQPIAKHMMSLRNKVFVKMTCQTMVGLVVGQNGAHVPPNVDTGSVQEPGNANGLRLWRV
ncbi:uncharacterized protein LOC128548873 [Mercenaria mercenaria]|uniref:uncharacterized protein LOC128548873 n=1 Tax=Mercenaria mercenaria TaxID=6596 RepID=UPI00234F2F57|nr:uncharacterized protein LOC128548873 [Mercenaria mercenaria]